jgi:Flp pilus assembly pilin Flp
MRSAIRFLRGEDGATLVEYGIVILIVACLAVLTVKQIGSKVSRGFESVNSQLP